MATKTIHIGISETTMSAVAQFSAAVDDLKESLEKDLWGNLRRVSSEAYDNKFAQMDDIIMQGKLAELVKQLMETNAAALDLIKPYTRE